MAVKNKLKIILATKGLKQNYIAEKANMSIQTVSNCINNRFNISLESAIKIANILEMKVEDIFYIEDL